MTDQRQLLDQFPPQVLRQYALIADGERGICVDGTTPPPERDLGLPGYPGAVAKTGNWVGKQFQLDTFGEALLLPAIRGAIPPADTRTIATLEAVRSELSREGFVYRYRPDQRKLGEAEGAFLLCGFVMALADHQQGNELAAIQWFERGRTAGGPLGLFTEEYDVDQRQLRGNLPQAFVHALLFETAHRLTASAGS